VCVWACRAGLECVCGSRARWGVWADGQLKGHTDRRVVFGSIVGGRRRAEVDECSVDMSSMAAMAGQREAFGRRDSE